MNSSPGCCVNPKQQALCRCSMLSHDIFCWLEKQKTVTNMTVFTSDERMNYLETYIILVVQTSKTWHNRWFPVSRNEAEMSDLQQSMIRKTWQEMDWVIRLMKLHVEKHRYHVRYFQLLIRTWKAWSACKAGSPLIDSGNINSVVKMTRNASRWLWRRIMTSHCS